MNELRASSVANLRKKWKVFLKNSFQELNITRAKIEFFLTGFSLLIALMIFSTYVGILSSFSTSRSILQSYDDDSAYGVETAIKSNWLNHNSSTTYGPLYYRLSAPLRYFLPNSYLSDGLSTSEKLEKSVHFQLLLINLVALFISTFLILNLITPSKLWSLIGSALLACTLLINPYRSQLLLTAKPDFLLACLVVIALIVTFEWMNDPQENKLRRTALIWGLASLTKLLTIFFAPSLLLILWTTDKIKFWKNVKFFTKWILIFYFIIGFPQSWDLWGYLKYLLQQNSHTTLVSWEFLRTEWIPLFFNDLWRSIVFIFIFSFLVPLRALSFHKTSLVQLLFFLLLAFLFVISKQTSDPFRWYTFPFTNAALVVWAFILIYLQQKNFFRLPAGMDKIRHSLWTPLIAFGLIPWVSEIFPKSIEHTYFEGMTCRPDAIQTKKTIDIAVSHGKNVLTDPYVPYNLDFHNQQVVATWEMSLDLLKDERWKILGLNRRYYSRYLVSSPTLPYMTDPQPATAYYRMFADATQAQDPWGNKWIQILKSPCGFELWEKKAPKKHRSQRGPVF